MHSLETGIVISIAMFFFFTFLVFTFKRERNISDEIEKKLATEVSEYSRGRNTGYKPETVNNILNIIIEGEKEYDDGENEE